MPLSSKFEDVWSGREQLAAVEPEPESLFCPPARALPAAGNDLIDPLERQQRPAEEVIYRAMVLLQIRYFRLLEKAPTAHRTKRSRRGHVCLHQVFEDAHWRLVALLERVQEIRLARPQKAAPPPQEAPATRQKTLADVYAELLTDVY